MDRTFSGEHQRVSQDGKRLHDPIVIIGAGLAGWSVARELRRAANPRPIVMVSEDSGDFYAKPSLSNAFSQGKTPAQWVTTPADAMAQSLNVQLLPRTKVQAIDRTSHTLLLLGPNGAQQLAYAKLVLAVGADAVSLPLAGDAARAVMRVNDLDDYRRFRDALELLEKFHGMGVSKAYKAHVTILGGGLIGSEFANDLALAGYRVTVVESAQTPLAALVPPAVGHVFARTLGEIGVTWHLGRMAKAVCHASAAAGSDATGGHQESSPARVVLDDGSEIATDLVLSAVGLRPRIALAQAAGLVVKRGIAVDATLATSDPDIFALGDCADYTIAGRPLPFVQPIMLSAKALAQSLAGHPIAIRIPPMPVIVKTPTMPVVSLPPEPGLTGEWHTSYAGRDSTAKFVSTDGQLLGFVLTGKYAAERTQWLSALGKPVALARLAA